MPQLTNENESDLLAYVLIDTEKQMAEFVADEVSKKEFKIGDDIVAAVYWVDAHKGRYDLVASVRATSRDTLYELLSGDPDNKDSIERVEGVKKARIARKFFRIVDGERVRVTTS